jgi:Methyltransferase domain
MVDTWLTLARTLRDSISSLLTAGYKRPRCWYSSHCYVLEVGMTDLFAVTTITIARAKTLLSLIREAILTRLGLRDPYHITTVRGMLLDVDKTILSKYAKTLNKGSTIVEIGSFLGLSAIIMGRSNRRCRIICVDPCDLSGEEASAAIYRREGYEGARQYRRLRLNLILYGIRAQIIRATSRDAVNRLSSRCQLLFVDGDHSYEACSRDVGLYGKWLDVGGTLILHDATKLGWPGPIKVARQLLNDSGWKFLEEGGYCMVFRKVA